MGFPHRIANRSHDDHDDFDGQPKKPPWYPTNIPNVSKASIPLLEQLQQNQAPAVPTIQVIFPCSSYEKFLPGFFKKTHLMLSLTSLLMTMTAAQTRPVNILQLP